MKISDITINNIGSYITSNISYYIDKLGLYPKYKKEQILYRLEICKNDCLLTSECRYCGCPTKKKVFQNTSCNKGERFPNIMNEKEWNEYKIQKKL